MSISDYLMQNFPVLASTTETHVILTAESAILVNSATYVHSLFFNFMENKKKTGFWITNQTVLV